MSASFLRTRFTAGAYPSPVARKNRLREALLRLLAVERVVVEGASMRPVLEPGDRLVALGGLRPRSGDIVVLTDPRPPGRRLVKRVAARPGSIARLPGGATMAAGAGFVVLGDNQDASTDSTTFGPVGAHLVRGRVVYRYGPPHRRGLVSGY